MLNNHRVEAFSYEKFGRHAGAIGRHFEIQKEAALLY
jgi:hypothetical protein